MPPLPPPGPPQEDKPPFGRLHVRLGDHLGSHSHMKALLAILNIKSFVIAIPLAAVHFGLCDIVHQDTNLGACWNRGRLQRLVELPAGPR